MLNPTACSLAEEFLDASFSASDKEQLDPGMESPQILWSILKNKDLFNFYFVQTLYSKSHLEKGMSAASGKHNTEQ